jgi:hypothetical protein
MVKPPLRTKSIGFKVSEEEYARLETAAQASGRTLGEWYREAILRGGSASDRERHNPALAEIVGVRLLLVNVLRPLAAGEKLAPRSRSQIAACLIFFGGGFRTLGEECGESRAVLAFHHDPTACRSVLLQVRNSSG